MKSMNRKREAARNRVAGVLPALALAAWLLSGGSAALALTNYSDITVAGPGDVFGIDTTLFPNPEPVYNYGNIRVTATDFAAQAFGIYATGDALNMRDVTAVANGDLIGAAYGILSDRASLSTEFAYSGEYSGETTLHGIWLKFVYAF